jgi:hypothetical protein
MEVVVDQSQRRPKISGLVVTLAPVRETCRDESTHDDANEAEDGLRHGDSLSSSGRLADLLRAWRRAGSRRRLTAPDADKTALTVA